MPRKKWINRNDPSTQTYTLLYRSQDDPLLHDESAGDRALFPTSNKQQTPHATSGNGASSSSAAAAEEYQRQKGLHLADLETAGEIDLQSMRENEGEAAEYGIYYDDSQYDYMQHLRDLGDGDGGSHFIEGIPITVKGKGKKKAGMRLEDALREVSIQDEEQENQEKSRSGGQSVLDSAGFSTFSKSERHRTYQDQQDVPDDIAGFQPDMDPRLREVLEALEDDAYVDDQDEEDVFGALSKVGKNEGEIDLYEFEGTFEEGEDDGWESDVTEKATQQVKEMKIPASTTTTTTGGEATSEHHISTGPDELPEEAAAAAVAEDGDWLRDFAKYKRDTASKKVMAKADGSIAAASGVQDKAPTLYTLNGTPLRQKKRKGALTNPSAYSMTSSSLARTDGQQLLDARFDQVEKMYALDEMEEFDEMDGGMSMVSGMTGQSKMSILSTTSFADEGAVRTDFDGMMDDFLGDWNKANPGGKHKGAKGKRGKNGNEKFGLQQLEEVRAELGRGRILRKPQKA